MNDFGVCLCDECDVVRDAITSAAPFVRCLQETKLHDVTALKAHTFLPSAFVASFHFLGASYITFGEGTAPAQPGHVGGKAAARAISIGWLAARYVSLAVRSTRVSDFHAPRVLYFATLRPRRVAFLS